MLLETWRHYSFLSKNDSETETERKTAFSTLVLVFQSKKPFLTKRLAFIPISYYRFWNFWMFKRLQFSISVLFHWSPLYEPKDETNFMLQHPIPQIFYQPGVR